MRNSLHLIYAAKTKGTLQGSCTRPTDKLDYCPCGLRARYDYVHVLMQFSVRLCVFYGGVCADFSQKSMFGGGIEIFWFLCGKIARVSCSVSAICVAKV